MGISLFKPKAKSYPLVSGVDAAKTKDDQYLARYYLKLFFELYV